jgi:ribosomal protein S16
MPELENVEKVKVAGFVDPRSRKNKNAERIKKDEEELQELLKAREEGAKPSEEVKEVSSTEEGEENPKEDKDLSKEELSFKKRYGDLRRHMASKDKETEERIKALEDQLSKATRNELVLPKSEEEIAEWTKKYPDVAGIVETIADKKARQRAGELDKRVQDIEKMRVEAVKEKAEAELMKLHPDFMDIRQDDNFHDWAEDQPKWVQDALYENVDDAKSVARVIDLYKIDAGITTKKSDSKKSAATAVNTRSKASPTADESNNYIKESQVDKMSDKEYAKNQEAIMEAMRTGKFVYDLSGAAR